MKKRFISLVAAAALVGGVAAVSVPTAANAGTVSVKGDTAVQMYGFVWAEYSWNKQASGNPDTVNMPNPDANVASSKLYKDTYDQTNYDADSWITRIGFSFKNEDAGLTGRIEGGFAHATNFRLRRAYVQHNFDNFYVLVGKEWILEETFASISPAFEAPAGFNEAILRVPQLRIGTKLDMSGATLDLALAFESGSKVAVSAGDAADLDTTTTTVSGTTTTSTTTYGGEMEVNRTVMPYVAARAKLAVETGFGTPATAYAWGSVIPVYVSGAAYNGAIDDAHYVSDDSQTSYAFGTGVKIPISMVTVGANYWYTDGATGYADISSLKPASYYNINGDVKDTTTNAFNVNVTVSPIPCVSVGAEYDYVDYKNDDAFKAISGNDDKPKVETYIGQVKINTTKYTTLTLEWRHMKAKNFDSTGLTADDSFSGDQVYALYKYTF